MKTLTITRFDTSDQGTFGILKDSDNNKICYTIELPWRDNKNSISCIKPGEYICMYTYSKSFRKHLYLLLKVEGRSGVRIHSGNVAGDVSKGYKTHSQGCIILGESLGKIDKQKAVFTSQPMLEKLYKLTNKESFKLIIKDATNK